MQLLLAQGTHQHVMVAEVLDIPKKEVDLGSITEPLFFILKSPGVILHQVPDRASTASAEARQPHDPIEVGPGRKARTIQVEFNPLDMTVQQQFD